MYISSPDVVLQKELILAHSITDHSFDDIIEWQVDNNNVTPQWLATKFDYMKKLKHHRLRYNSLTLVGLSLFSYDAITLPIVQL